MKGGSWAAVLVLVLAGCAAVYGERPAGTGARPPERDSGRADPEEREPAPSERPAAAGVGEETGTIVGTIGPEGALVADTLQGLPADTSRVERETVVTGTIRRAAGWRVQVFAHRDALAAAEVASRLEERVPGEDVHIEAEDGWHKVRVGDFATREDAERLRSALAELGFPEAWVVRTAVRRER